MVLKPLSELDSYSGMFYLPNLNSYRASPIEVFCVPLNIKVYSAPTPVKFRVVSYEMYYWDTIQPKLPEDLDNKRQYRNPKNGLTRFEVNIHHSKVSIVDILAEIRRHFVSTEVMGNGLGFIKGALDRLKLSNKATIDLGEDKVTNIIHTQEIDYVDTYQITSDSVTFTLTNLEGISETLVKPLEFNKVSSLIEDVKTTLEEGSNG